MRVRPKQPSSKTDYLNSACRGRLSDTVQMGGCLRKRYNGGRGRSSTTTASYRFFTESFTFDDTQVAGENPPLVTATHVSVVDRAMRRAVLVFRTRAVGVQVLAIL
jgi:hypothetical protein